MIAWVEGSLRQKTPARVVVDVHGVGYELLIPLSTFAALPDEGKTVALHVHTHVREDAIQLFGFATSAERATFELLLKASRVGPRLAQNILSGIAADVLVAAIQRGDVSSLRSVPGVGKKTAERIVVELRDRADEVAARTGAVAPGTGAGAAREIAAQAISALQNLGYPRSQAERVVEAATAEVGEEVSLEVLIREALRRLAR
ncbi:MAG: Holliday junction branch migration protein RuvA [Proteobacteria bacterium]|nr:Holliday junction branch migration protein RuvA [Pseudomonadota bacterium]